MLYPLVMEVVKHHQSVFDTRKGTVMMSNYHGHKSPNVFDSLMLEERYFPEVMYEFDDEPSNERYGCKGNRGISE